MNKIIFQIALLGFFVSMVLLGITSMPLLEVMVKSFIVCISIIISGIAILAVLRFTGRPEIKNESPETGEGNEASKPSSMNQMKESPTEKTTYKQKQKETPLPV